MGWIIDKVVKDVVGFLHFSHLVSVMDGDLDRIRAQRLAELKGQAAPGQQQRNPEEDKAREDMRRCVQMTKCAVDSS